jgi:DNA-binding MarR family transcriptional regulator
MLPMSDDRDLSPESIRHALNRKELAAVRQRAALARLLGLGETDVLAIQHLAVAGELTGGQLGALLGMSSGGSTALVHRLERRGYVAREPHPHDRRSTLLALSPGIERRVGELLGPLAQRLDGLAGALSVAERQAVADFLSRVAEAGERHADELSRRADATAQPDRVVTVPKLWA